MANEQNQEEQETVVAPSAPVTVAQPTPVAQPTTVAQPTVIEAAPYKYWFNDQERALFTRVLAVQSVDGNTTMMRRLIKNICREVGADRVWSESGNVYAVKGTAALYPCVVAHTDTVHDILPADEYQVMHNPETGEWWARNPTKTVTTKEGKTYHPQVGVGGDDKVGIYVALNMLRTEKVLKVAFFRDEEIGCVGAREADMAFFDDTAFVLECDRRGTKQFVDRIGGLLFSEAFREAVKPILKEHEFAFVSGAPTDVGALKRSKGLAVSCANIACGYYLPHSDNEYIVEHDVLAAQFVVEDIIANLGTQAWPHVPPKATYVAPVRQSSISPWDQRDRLDEEELRKKGFVRSEFGFFYRYNGDRPDPLGIVPAITLILGPNGDILLPSDPKDAATLLGSTTATTLVDVDSEQQYCSTLAAALRGEHPAWTNDQLLRAVQDHYNEMMLHAKRDLLEPEDAVGSEGISVLDIPPDLPNTPWVNWVLDAMSSPYAEAAPADHPAKCPLCGSERYILWEGYECQWACGEPDCESLFDYPEGVHYRWGYM